MWEIQIPFAGFCPRLISPNCRSTAKTALMEFSGPKLKEMIRKTYFAISPDESRQALNGLLLEQDKDHVNLVGTDGHRLSFIPKAAVEIQCQE